MNWPDDYCEREYLDWLHGQPCVITGYEASPDVDCPAVDPAHTTTGRYGRGMKPPPWHCQPLHHDLHLEQGATTEAKFWRKRADDMLLMEFVKAHGRWRYLCWASEEGLDLNEVVHWMREEGS